MKLFNRALLIVLSAILLSILVYFIYDWISEPRQNDFTKNILINTLSSWKKLNDPNFKGWCTRVDRRRDATRPSLISEFEFLVNTNDSDAVYFRFYHTTIGRCKGSFDGENVSAHRVIDGSYFGNKCTFRRWAEGEFDPEDEVFYRMLNDVVLTNGFEKAPYGPADSYIKIVGWHDGDKIFTETIYNPSPEKEAALRALVKDKLVTQARLEELERLQDQYITFSNSLEEARALINTKCFIAQCATAVVPTNLDTNYTPLPILYPVLVFPNPVKFIDLSAPVKIMLPPAVRYLGNPVKNLLAKHEVLYYDESKNTWVMYVQGACRDGYVVYSNRGERIDLEDANLQNIAMIIVVDSNNMPYEGYYAGPAGEFNLPAYKTRVRAFSMTPDFGQINCIASFDGDPPSKVSIGPNPFSITRNDGLGSALEHMNNNFLDKL